MEQMPIALNVGEIKTLVAIALGINPDDLNHVAVIAAWNSAEDRMAMGMFGCEHAILLTEMAVEDAHNPRFRNEISTIGYITFDKPKNRNANRKKNRRSKN